MYDLISELRTPLYKGQFQGPNGAHSTVFLSSALPCLAILFAGQALLLDLQKFSLIGHEEKPSTMQLRKIHSVSINGVYTATAFATISLRRNELWAPRSQTLYSVPILGFTQ